MTRETEIKLKALIHDHLTGMWDNDDENILEEFVFGDDTLALAAEAAANVILAGETVREYIKREKVE